MKDNMGVYQNINSGYSLVVEMEVILLVLFILWFLNFQNWTSATFLL